MYDSRINNNIKYYRDDKRNYEYLEKGLSDLESYKKGYNSRYAKKKGLAKLDCYYEKKLFDKMDDIHHVAEKMQNRKDVLKKTFLNKYSIRLILFTLIPMLGIIFPILFCGKRGSRLINWTSVPHGQYGPDKKCPCTEPHNYIHLFDGQISFHTSFILNAVITAILIIIVSFVIFYILKKVIKYEGLKAGKGIMNRKEYLNFCKELIQNKAHQ
ncbi:hypothetical protein PVMG_05752 [Plasmodium vivax Mauritania I]|uniref:Variable surface protein Vir35 n=2 Tax=Plasmodium vivax TaxID=5855 RepID=A0A0J9TIU5_PLAVI|nr:hypothetical protein PVBG_06194 [Plasmodium vivax Brazil I]KMZ94991.1 hypothetical protein PVMG_05752 [Plasmodium vivax Mauritania I]